jgi:hypothetical protein
MRILNLTKCVKCVTSLDFLLDMILDALLTHMSVNKVAADRELKFALKISAPHHQTPMQCACAM